MVYKRKIKARKYNEDYVHVCKKEYYSSSMEDSPIKLCQPVTRQFTHKLTWKNACPTIFASRITDFVFVSIEDHLPWHPCQQLFDFSWVFLTCICLVI